jgi:hypothetical protein
LGFYRFISRYHHRPTRERGKQRKRGRLKLALAIWWACWNRDESQVAFALEAKAAMAIKWEANRHHESSTALYYYKST